jgi:3-phosphoshikimate 1-carboxyvinyltransferase
MKKIITPSDVKINLIAPSSKSVMIRSIIFGMLSIKHNPELETIEFDNFTECDDVNVILKIAEVVGFRYYKANTKRLILIKEPSSKNTTSEISFGESGLIYRMFSEITQLFFDEKISFSAEGSLKQRIIYDQQKEHKYEIISSQNLNTYTIDCSLTSQYLTGLLTRLCFDSKDSVVVANNLVSIGYVGLTIDILKKFGFIIKQQTDAENRTTTFLIDGKQRIKSVKKFHIEGDWSGASFLFVLGAIAGDVVVTNLSSSSLQPDKKILELFLELSINCIEFSENCFSINKSDFSGFEFDATDCPDLIMPLVVLAMNSKSSSKIYGIDRLVNKESNRKEVLLKVFSMIGGKIKIDGNSFIVNPSKLSGGILDSHNDHRIAMAIGIAAKRGSLPITLTRTECVKKSFPDFFDYLK